MTWAFIYFPIAVYSSTSRIESESENIQCKVNLVIQNQECHALKVVPNLLALGPDFMED